MPGFNEGYKEPVTPSSSFGVPRIDLSMLNQKVTVARDEIGKYLGVDSLEYLTNEEMLDAVSEAGPENFCHACFSGSYPTPVDLNFKKEIYEV